MEGKVGPTPVEGTLTAADRQEIWDKTQCSAAVRARQKRERSLTISGPVSKLEQAHKLAMEAMEKNKQTLESGESLPAAGGDFKGTEERKAAGTARRDTFADPNGGPAPAPSLA